VYIGASERNGYGRQLVLEDDGKYYIYDIKPSNLTQFDATIPDEVLERQGISKKSRTPSIAEQSDPDIQNLADMNRRPATDFDVKLATDTPDEGQKAIIKAEREKSPLAKLPAGAEGKLSDAELKELIESPADEESKTETETDSPVADRAIKNAISKIDSGEKVSLDDVLEDVKLKAPSVGGDDDISFFDDDEDEVTPAPASEAPVAKPAKPAKPVIKTEPESTPDVPELPADEPVAPAKTPKAPNRVVEKIDPASLDGLGKPEDYNKYFGFDPSEEQTRFLNSIVKAKKSTAVRAGAGAGKTTTYIGTTKALEDLDPNARIALLQFNRINANEAAKLVPKNTISNTTDAFFGRPYLVSMGKSMADRYLSKERWHISSPKQLAELFEMEDVLINGENATPSEVAGIVRNALSKFSYSTDTEIGPQHFNLSGFGNEQSELRPESMEKLLSYANKYWKDLTSLPGDFVTFKKKDGTTGKKRVTGVTRIQPEHAVKMWALSKPDLSKLRSDDGKPITHLFLDEAQDTNAVLEKVINDNIDAGTAPLIAMVGDRSQTIYAFRGTSDALSTFAEGRAESVIGLTTTRRFGENIVNPANAFLNLIGEDYRLKSEIEGGELLETRDLDDIPDAWGKTTVLTRTNGAAFQEMTEFLLEEKVVGISQVLKDDLDNAVGHLEWLLSDFSSRPKNPPVVSEDFLGMKSRKDLQTAAKIDPQSKAAYWERLLSFSGDADAAVKKLRELSESVVVEREQLDVESITNLDASTGNSGEFSNIGWRIEGDSLILQDTVKNAIFQKPLGSTKEFRDLVIGNKKAGLDPEVLLPDGTVPQWRARKIGADWVSQILIPSDSERTAYLNKIASLFQGNTKEPPKIDVRVSTAHRFKGKQDENIIIADDFSKPGVDEDGNPKMPSQDELNLAYVSVTRPTKRIYLGSLAWGMDYEGRDGLAKANQELERDSDFGMEIWDREMADQDKIREKRASKAGLSLKASTSTGYNGDVYFSDDEMDFPEGTGSSLQAPSNPPKKFVDDWGINQKGFSKRIDGTTWNITENKDGTITVRPRTNEDRVSARKYNNWSEAEKDFPKFQQDAKAANTEKLVDTVSAFDKDGEIAKVIREGGDSEDILKAITSSEDYTDAVDEGRINFVSLYAALDNAGTSGLKPPKTRKPRDINPPKFINSADLGSSEYDKYPNAHDDGESDINILDIDDEVLLNTKTKSTNSEIVAKLIQFGGKIQPDGSVPIFRRRFYEETGPAEGQERILEARYVGSKATRSILYYKITDPSGEVETREFRVRDVFDSFGALINKLNSQMDTYWQRDIIANPPSSDPADNAERIRDYSGIEGSIRNLRKANFRNLLRDRKASITNMRMLTDAEHAQLLLSGRDMRLAGGAEDWQKVQLKGIDSVTDAIEAGEIAAAASLFQQYLLNIPDTKQAQDTAKKVLRNMVENRFPNMDKRKMESILSDMNDKVDSALPKTGLVVRPHADKNGAPVSAGSIVTWTNNVGEKAVGVVDQLLSYDNPNGGQYSYADYALVLFKGIDKPVPLTTGNMTVLPNGTLEDRTSYSPWIKNEDLKIERALARGFTYDPETGKFFDKGTEVDAIDFPEDNNLFAETTVKKPVKDLKVGDAIYDDEGNLYGKVEKVKAGVVNGEDKIGVKLEGNNKPLFFDPEEDTNVEKPRGSAAPKSDVPAGPATPEAERAKALGLNSTDGGKSSTKRISKNPDKLDPDTNSNIRGSKTLKAIKPTDEARAAKEEVLSIGAELQKQAEVRLAEKLREKGIEIDPSRPFEDQIDDSAAKAASDAYANLIVAESTVKDFEESNLLDVKSQSYSKTYEGMVADGFATKDGIDKTKLAKALKDSGLETLSYNIRPEDSKKGKSPYLAYAYTLLKNDGLRADALEVYKSRDDAEKENIRAKEARAESNNIIKNAQAEATLEILKENGVKFDTVSYADFEGRIVTDEGGNEFRPNSTFKSAVALQQAFDRMPEAAIRQLAEHLKNTDQKLFVKAGVKRGSFSKRAGGYRLQLSASSRLNNDINKHTDTALHELQHFLEAVDPNLRTIGHAWAYDRLIENVGTDKESLPNIVSIPGTKGELTFAKVGIAAPYMNKSYDTRGNFFLTPNSMGSEVTSVLMQDMFTDPGMASMPNGQYTVSWDMIPIKKGPRAGQLYKKYKITRDAFYDEESDSWFKDEEMNEPIQNVVSYFGRAKRDGLDRDIKSLGMGLVMMMNDWNPITGFGPGNAVETPSKPGNKTPSKSEIFKKLRADGATIVEGTNRNGNYELEVWLKDNNKIWDNDYKVGSWIGNVGYGGFKSEAELLKDLWFIVSGNVIDGK
jgi:superfamily I DNA/RNA helicase